MKNSIFKHRVEYFSMRTRSESECYTYAKHHYPWCDAIFVSPSLRLVAVFANHDDFLRFLDFYTA